MTIFKIENIINILKKYDIKKCSNGINCKNIKGPILSFKDFYDNKNYNDGKNIRCIICNNYDYNYQFMDQIKKDKMTKYFSLKSIKDRENEIINFYTKNFYTYKQIKSITGESIENIKQTMKKRDIKVCNRGKDCKTFGGPILRYKNFNKDDDYTCKNCKRYENQCLINPSKINDIEKFHKLSSFEEKESFIVKLYKKDYLTYQEIESITFFKVSEVIKIIQKNKIKRCGNKNNCKNPNGPILEINEFDKDEASIDGKTFLCKKCFQENYYSDIINNQEKRRIYQNSKSKFDSFINQIKFYHEVRRDPNNHMFLQVKCHNVKCKKWFNPTNNQVSSRINAINGYYNSLGIENNFYCSEECKNSCHLYKTKVSELITQQRLKNDNYQSEDFKRMQSELRAYFLSVRNPDKCELCGTKKDQKELILHHKIPVAIDYVVEADNDNVIFVCENCNEKAYQKDGCKLGQLREKVIC